MKFIRLEILNLASLDRQGGEVINFDEGVLGNSTIFSIVGPTGSGKSTLLDAICLALYNRAPRYPRKKGDRSQIDIYGEQEDDEKKRLSPTDCRNILSRGKKEGYSKLTFLANNGCLYRAEWHVKFNRVKYDNAHTHLFKLTFEDKGTSTLLTEESARWEDLPTIIGLDYEQFLRTVLIAQGSFANFLTAKEDERYELLEKLVGTKELYTSIAEKIKNQKDEAVNAYNEISANVKAYEENLIAEEELQKLNGRFEELDAEAQKVNDELEKVKESLQWFTNENQHIENLERFKSILNAANLALEDIKDQVARLALHDATLPAVGYFNEQKTLQANIEKAEATLKTLGEKIEGMKKTIEDENTTLATLKAAAEKAANALNEQKPHIDKARIIKGELNAANKTLGEKLGAKSDAEKALTSVYKNIEEAYDDLEININQATEALRVEEEKLNVLDAATLQEADRIANQKKHNIQDAIKMRQDINTCLKDIEKAKDEIEQLIKRNKAIDEEISKLGLETLQQELETLQKTYTLMTSENWAQHRKDLEEGKPCPLCGAVHHPYQTNEAFIPVVTEMDQLIKEKDKAFNEAKGKEKKLTEEKGRNNGSIGEKRKSIGTLTTNLEDWKKKWSEMHTTYPDWPEEEEQLTTLQPIINDEAEKAAKVLNEYNNLITRINKLRKVKVYEEAKSAFDEAQKDVNAKLADIKVEIGDKDPDDFERQLIDAKTKAGEDVNKQNEKIGQLKNDQQGLEGQVQATQESKTTDEGKLANTTAQLDKWLREYNAAPEHQPKLTIEDIACIAGYTDDWEAIRTEQQNRKTALTAAKTTFENEQDAHKSHQEKKPEQAKEALEARKTELEQYSDEERIRLKARKQRHDEAVLQMGTLRDEIGKKGQVKTEWEEIASAIGAEGKTLRKIAQCYTLRFLIEHANVEIRKFNSRYELQQVKNSLGIRVIDHDRADDVRDTTSLSGGETFIVSLGLALGLSSLSSRNISFENLFIDEGFGTLDNETLETVIDSLAMLQASQGKKVGVISHTDTMAERITTKICIIKDGNGSSHIQILP